MLDESGSPRDLLPHPAAPAPDGFRVTVAWVRVDASNLALGWTVRGPLERIRIPAWTDLVPGVDLWKHTCMEAFLAPPTGTAYRELNLSPSGAWAAHAFRDYRDGGPVETACPLTALSVDREEGELSVRARMDLAGFGPELVAAPIRMGLTAVLEDTSGALSYWALRHPAATPDFHDATSFAIRVPA